MYREGLITVHPIISAVILAFGCWHLTKALKFRIGPTVLACLVYLAATTVLIRVLGAGLIVSSYGY